MRWCAIAREIRFCWQRDEPTAFMRPPIRARNDRGRHSRMLNTIHTLLGSLALINGAANILLPKGTRLHRRIGKAYATSLVLTLITSFFIYDLFGSFGPYHVMSIVSAITLGLALYFPFFRRGDPGWIHHHYMWMSFSYVGLVMATNSHLFPYGPRDWRFVSKAFLYWGSPMMIGLVLIFANRSKAIRRGLRNMNKES